MPAKTPIQPPAITDPPVLPAEEWHVLHLYYRIDPGWLRSFDSGGAADGLHGFEQTVETIRALPDVQLVVLSMVGAKADLGRFFIGLQTPPSALIESLGLKR